MHLLLIYPFKFPYFPFLAKNYLHILNLRNNYAYFWVLPAFLTSYNFAVD